MRSKRARPILRESPHPDYSPPRELVRAYDYTDPDGNLVFQVVRYKGGQRGKTFRYQYKLRPTGVWIPRKHPDAARYLYRLPEVVAAVAQGAPVLWCEGEKDAEAVVSAGQCATSHHGGAGKATLEQAMWFKGFAGQVYLLLDNDDDDASGSYRAGAACAYDRYKLLRSVGLQPGQIRFRRAATGKDIADHLGAGLPLSKMIHVPRSQVAAWSEERTQHLVANATKTSHGSSWTKYAREGN